MIWVVVSHSCLVPDYFLPVLVDMPEYGMFIVVYQSHYPGIGIGE